MNTTLVFLYENNIPSLITKVENDYNRNITNNKYISKDWKLEIKIQNI